MRSTVLCLKEAHRPKCNIDLFVFQLLAFMHSVYGAVFFGSCVSLVVNFGVHL